MNSNNVKLDKIIERIGKIDSTLSAQHITLQDHIRRTEILEKEIVPLTKNMNMLQGAVKLIALAGVIATVVEAIHSMFK